MIYPKFPQRYLAAIVFCFVLTLAALSTIFLIYLFNSDRSSLILSFDSGATVANKPSMYLYGGGDDDNNNINKYDNHQHHLLEQQKSREVHLDNDKYDSESRFAAESAVGANKPPTKVGQRKHWVHTGFIRMQEHGKVQSTASRLELKLDKGMPTVGVNAKLMYPLLPPLQGMHASSETSEDLTADQDEKELSLMQVLGEAVKKKQLQTHPTKVDSDKYDTIYIDDFERLSSGESHDQDELGTYDRNTEANNVSYLDALKLKNFVFWDNKLTTEATSTSNSSNISSNGNKSPWTSDQMQVKKKKYRLHSFDAKKNKKLSNLHKHQHRQNSTNDVGRSRSVKITSSNSDVKQQLQQDSLQKTKQLPIFQYVDENLDASFDLSSNYDMDEVSAGSGSGDFTSDDSDDEDDDYDIDDDTANFIKRINLRMWQTMSDSAAGKLQWKLRKQQQSSLYPTLEKNNNKPRRYNLNQTTLKNNNRESRYRKIIPSIIDNFYSISSEIVSNLSAPQLYQDERIFATNPAAATSTFQVASPSFASSSAPSFTSSVGNKRINQISASMATVRGATMSVGDWQNKTNGGQGSMSPQPLGGATETKTMVTLMNASPTSQQQIDEVGDVSESATVSATNADSGSAAWLETRTRRIMGNVKKSEERSRQLLLCEEAGGGELCRMLFKGNLNE